MELAADSCFPVGLVLAQVRRELGLARELVHAGQAHGALEVCCLVFSSSACVTFLATLFTCMLLKSCMLLKREEDNVIM